MNINPKAWKEDETLRAAILARSAAYKFTESDYSEIRNALAELGDRGNRQAWKFVEARFTPEGVKRRLLGATAINNNAIDDLISVGTDDPERYPYSTWGYARDEKVRNSVLERAKGICEYCGEEGFLKADGSPYLETHHIIALAKQGPDRITNVIALCAHDQRRAHFALERAELESEMLAKLSAINAATVGARQV